jgi:hypothetical protein
MFAQYEDQVVVTYVPEYLKDAGEYGVVNIEEYFAVFDKDEFTEENVTSYFEEEILSDLSLYEGVTLMKWNYTCEDLNEDGYPELVTAYPDYEYDTPVVYAFGEEIMVFAANAGQTISLPTEIAGYYVTWEDIEGNQYTGSYTVPSDFVAGDQMLLTAIQGDAVENEDDPSVKPEDPVNPDNPTDPEKPENPVTPEDPEKPTDSDNKDEAEKPVDPEKPGQSSTPGATAPDTSDSTNSVSYMVVLLMGVAFVMLAVKKRQMI